MVDTRSDSELLGDFIVRDLIEEKGFQNTEALRAEWDHFLRNRDNHYAGDIAQEMVRFVKQHEGDIKPLALKKLYEKLVEKVWSVDVDPQLVTDRVVNQLQSYLEIEDDLDREKFIKDLLK
jgi:hypothetical protein